MKEYYVTGAIQSSGKLISQVGTILTWKDIFGALMVRWGIARDKYRVTPGLYAAGKPSTESDIFVTANYKLSFDHLRKNLSGLNSWILILDTKGINVWCAAGKGTFGTKELVTKIKDNELDKLVNHRRLILPQLGGTGVAAHKVKDATGFNVQYGPILADDIKRFLDNGYRADPDMRKVKFGFRDRVKLLPNDFFQGKWYLLGAMAVTILISFIKSSFGSLKDLLTIISHPAINSLLSYFSGIVVTPVLLPYLPGRFFSVKGAISGSFIFLILLILNFTRNSSLEKISWFFIITAISSFTAMNFTGSSTFTSLSGVKKEMKISLPFQIGSAVVGLILQVISKLI